MTLGEVLVVHGDHFARERDEIGGNREGLLLTDVRGVKHDTSGDGAGKESDGAEIVVGHGDGVGEWAEQIIVGPLETSLLGGTLELASGLLGSLLRGLLDGPGPRLLLLLLGGRLLGVLGRRGNGLGSGSALALVFLGNGFMLATRL